MKSTSGQGGLGINVVHRMVVQGSTGALKLYMLAHAGFLLFIDMVDLGHG